MLAQAKLDRQPVQLLDRSHEFLGRRAIGHEHLLRHDPLSRRDLPAEPAQARHKHKPPRHHFRGPGRKPPGVPTFPLVNTDPRPPGAYQGPFGRDQAVRLLDRAGFGAVPGQAEQLASLGLVGAVQS